MKLAGPLGTPLGLVKWKGALAAPGKSDLHAHGEGELVITLESWEAARSSRGVEEGLSDRKSVV